MKPLAAVALLITAAQLCLSQQPDWPSVEQHAVDVLRRYVQIPSVNPPADTRAAAKLIRDELAGVGIEAHLYESGPGGKTNLIARLPGRDHTKRPLLLLNHMDVVPVDPSRWPVEPFSGAIKDGQMWGRGTLDMKSTGIVQLETLISLKRLGIAPARDIVFLAVCDEETGGTAGAAWMIQNHWPELNPEFVLDEGGPGSRDAYSPGKLVFGVSVADKQVLWLRLKATGTSGHGSQPIPDNANDALMHAIARAKDLPPSDKGNGIVADMRRDLGAFAENKFINAIQKNTISVTSLRSGVGDPPKANVIPSTAEATIDCRLLPGQSAEDFISEIKARINDPRVTVEMISPVPDDAPPSDSHTALFHAITAAIKQETPGAEVVPIVVPFGTDGQKFRVRGANSYGLFPMVIGMDTLATMHSDSEHIPLSEFRRGLHIYFDILRANW